jgi:hypothetical protein
MCRREPMKNATLHWVDFNDYFAEDFCLDYGGNLVFSGNFLGVPLLVNADEETSFDQIRDDLAEEFAMEPTAFRILRYSRSVQGKLARDVGRADFPTSVDFMVLVLGGGKRARSTKNPFAAETLNLVTRADGPLFELAFTKAIELQERPQTDVITMIKAFDADLKAKVVAILKDKQNAEYKIRDIIALLPDFAAMSACSSKLMNTSTILQERFAAALWDQITSKTSSGKFNADILRALLELPDDMED